MDNDNYYVDREKEFQIEKLANENELLREKLQEKNEKINRLEKELFYSIQKNNQLDLNKVGKAKSKGESNEKIYKKCQKCGVVLISPKPGRKYCARHVNLSINSDNRPNEHVGYKHVKIYQGGSPGSGKKR